MEIGGRTLTAIFSDLAEQANGSVMLKYGETIVLATAVMTKEKQTGLGFFNLTVDYVEKFYAAGKILGSRFTRREGKPSDDAILSCRVIDRTIRPLFDKHLKHGIQIIVSVISVDGNDPTMLAVNAASLALATSNIPWNGPVCAVRIGNFGGETLINPRLSVRENSIAGYDIMVCGRGKHVNMIEAACFEVKEEEISKAFELASAEIGRLEEFQKQIVKEIGAPKHDVEMEKISDEAVKLFNENAAPKMEEAVFSNPGDGVAGKKKLNELHTFWNTLVKKTFPDREDFGPEDDHFDDAVNDMLHKAAISKQRRADGRKMDELRPLFGKAGGLSQIIHGSGIFYRGGTHMLSVLTLGGPEDAHFKDGMETKEEKRFMHHYNFPPFSGGETGRATMVNRREIGHGALAEKALAAVLPGKEKFPYTIRVVSESLASNGSTSMAAVCAGSLALLDGGVPIKATVAGISIGLMQESDEKYELLTDIQGPEDHHGDMDFKVAGTKNGVTAIQLDIKVGGIALKILAEALEKAKIARLQIIEVLDKVLPAPRPDISKNAPKILTTKIKVSQIGLLIGPGGKTINGIKDKTGAEVNVEDDGTVYLTGKLGTAEAALKMVLDLTHEFLPGDMLNGEVVKIMEFGAFVRLNQNTDGLVHISELAPWRINRVSDILKEGDIVPVKIKEIDARGKYSLSIKMANPDFFKKE